MFDLARRVSAATLVWLLVPASPLWAQSVDEEGSGSEAQASSPAAEAAEPTAEATPTETGRDDVLLLAPRTTYGADAPRREPRADTWDAFGLLRLRQESLTDFAVDNLGTRHGRANWTETRVIVGAAWVPTQQLRLEVELDAFNGQVSGDGTELGLAIDPNVFRVDRSGVLPWSEDSPVTERTDSNNGTNPWLRVYPRKAFVQFDSPVGRFIMGAQTFGWGTGMLANDGLSEPDFGDAWRGSLVARFAFATRPWSRSGESPAALRNLAFILAGDRVIEDDNASWYEGDDAWAGVFGIRTETPRFAVGAFNAVRVQQDRRDRWYPENRRTEVFANTTDLWGRWHILDLNHHRLTLEGEGAMILGRTDRPWLDETFEDGAAIRAFGGLLRVRWDYHPAHLTAKLEAGYASGDNDPRDDVARQFAMNSDYNVGLILFDQVMPLITARAGDRLFDPNLIAVPPAAVRFTVAQGGVTNAAYLNPIVRWQPIRDLDLRLGYVLATSAADLVDVYQTARNGGYNANVGGQPGGSHFLGQEIDFGARYTFRLPASLAIRVGGETGVFLPGKALDGLDGGAGIPTLVMARGLFDFLW